MRIYLWIGVLFAQNSFFLRQCKCFIQSIDGIGRHALFSRHLNLEKKSDYRTDTNVELNSISIC